MPVAGGALSSPRVRGIKRGLTRADAAGMNSKNRSGAKREAAETGSNRRRFGRVITQDIGCSLGEVEDLSGGGMRVMTRQAPPREGDVFTCAMRTPDGELFVSCLCRWVRRAGLFKWEVGVEFCELSPASRGLLAALARTVAHNETILPWLKHARERAG